MDTLLSSTGFPYNYYSHGFQLSAATEQECKTRLINHRYVMKPREMTMDSMRHDLFGPEHRVAGMREGAEEEQETAPDMMK